jgi:large subunit ribosomal protein L1
MDDDLKHDPLTQYKDENLFDDEQTAIETDTFEVRSAEESAMNTDNDVAQEATEMTAITHEETVAEAQLEAEAAIIDDAVDRKHKNRESTSEKAKKASETRILKGESTTADPVSQKALDPLRLRGKKYRAKVGLVDKNRVYTLAEAMELVKETSTSTFDAAVEMHCKVKGDAVRGTVTLPSGSGKTKKVAIADDETLEKIAAGVYDFDVLLATPAQMPKLAKFAKALGPKGLMPSPKAGTVTDDLERVSAEIGGGRIEYRADKNSVVHVSIGRVSFAADKLAENFQAMENALSNAKLQSISVASTMGPGIRVALTK